MGVKSLVQGLNAAPPDTGTCTRTKQALAQFKYASLIDLAMAKSTMADLYSKTYLFLSSVCFQFLPSAERPVKSQVKNWN